MGGVTQHILTHVLGQQLQPGTPDTAGGEVKVDEPRPQNHCGRSLVHTQPPIQAQLHEIRPLRVRVVEKCHGDGRQAGAHRHRGHASPVHLRPCVHSVVHRRLHRIHLLIGSTPAIVGGGVGRDRVGHRIGRRCVRLRAGGRTTGTGGASPGSGGSSSWWQCFRQLETSNERWAGNFATQDYPRSPRRHSLYLILLTQHPHCQSWLDPVPEGSSQWDGESRIQRSQRRASRAMRAQFWRFSSVWPVWPV